MNGHEAVLQTFCSAVNAVKRTGFDATTIDAAHGLYRDLDIDSIELLGIWCRVEKALQIRIPDDEKWQVHTVGDAVAIVARHTSVFIAEEGAVNV